MATKKSTVVEIKPIEVVETTVRIYGDTPLIMHAWSAKAKKEMLDAQQGKKKGKQKEPKNPMFDFVESIYWLDKKPPITNDMSVEDSEIAFAEFMQNENPRFGFPATAFKQAAISAAYRMGWSKDKMSIRGAFYIQGDENGMVEIHSDNPIMREDMVKIGMGTADLRYRGEFRNWYADLNISYNKNGNFALSTIVNMINAGGYICGVGEWRPERDGTYGMFHVVIE